MPRPSVQCPVVSSVVSHWKERVPRDGDVPAVQALAKDRQQAAVHPHPAGLLVDVAEDARSWSANPL